MALKPKQIVSPLTDAVPLEVGGRFWTVTVRHLSRAHDQEMLQRATREETDRNPGRAPNQQRIQDAYALSACRELIAGWSGLTPEILSMLVEEPDGGYPEPDSNGQVPFTAELCEYIWTFGRLDLFQNPIYSHARRVLEITQLRKDVERKNWPGSSASSTAPDPSRETSPNEPRT